MLSRKYRYVPVYCVCGNSKFVEPTKDGFLLPEDLLCEDCGEKMEAEGERKERK